MEYKHTASKVIKRIFILGILLCMGFIYGVAQEISAVEPTSGDGSEINPYQISSLAHLRWISETSDQWDKHFLQTAYINASGSSVLNGNAGFSPIGNQETPFTGQYVGADFIIDSLYINRPSQDLVGLFGKVNNAIISNVDINEARVTGNSNVGGLIGASLLPSGTEITNVSIRNSIVISNSGLIGGIAGNMEGVVLSNSYCSEM